MQMTGFKVIVFLTGFTLLCRETIAQHFVVSGGSGIYLTESDFIKNSITLFAENDAANLLEHSLGDVTLTRAGKKYKLGRGSFFGYYQDGERYRYYQDDTKILPSYGYYKIIEESGVVVYSRVVSGPKTGEHTWYYYSDTVNSPIKRLSVKSLKKVPQEIYPVLAKYLLMKAGKNFIPEEVWISPVRMWTSSRRELQSFSRFNLTLAMGPTCIGTFSISTLAVSRPYMASVDKLMALITW